MMRSTTTRSQAFVLGAAAGAGFGFLEALLYGVGAVHQSGPGTWWAVMLVRGGSTSLHVLNTGLVGLAWWYGSFGQAKRRAWLLFSLAVVLHALWNGFAIVLDSRIFGLETLSHEALTFVAYSIVGVLAMCFITAIPLIARRLREPQIVPL
jgi:RsiW-degrading membrane proteinase PrsW (M82 family)